jgi:hypothetical protein
MRQCALEHAHQRDLSVSVVGRVRLLSHLGLQGLIDEDLGDILLENRDRLRSAPSRVGGVGQQPGRPRAAGA